MSELLLTWLEDDVKLGRPVKDIEKDFSNGFLYSELLTRLGYMNVRYRICLRTSAYVVLQL